MMFQIRLFIISIVILCHLSVAAAARDWVAGINCRVETSSLIGFNEFDGTQHYTGWDHSVDVGDVAYISIVKYEDFGETTHTVFVTDQYTSDPKDLGALKFKKTDFASARLLNKKERYNFSMWEDTFEIEVYGGYKSIFVDIGRTVDGLWKGFLVNIDTMDVGVLTQTLTCSKPWRKK